MIGGSQQLRTYRRARAKGLPTEQAAALAGIQIGEAKLIDAEDARNPPPTDALLPISAPLDPDPALAGSASTTQETTMARGRRKAAGTVNGEIAKPDFEMAVKIYREDIKPAAGTVGEAAQEMSTAYKAIKKQAHIQPQAARLAFRLDTMEESKRDDWLRCFRGLLTELKIFMPSDLVDAAQGNGAAGGEVIPIGERKAPQLATISSATDDLAGPDPETFAVRLISLDEWLLPDGEEWTSDKADAGHWTKARAEELRAEFPEPSDIEVVEDDAPVGGSMIAQAAE